MPGTPIENRTQTQSNKPAGFAPAIQSTRPDPRRPIRRTRETDENVHATREPSQSSTGSSISKLDKADKTSSEWEVLSDADSRLNEGGDPVVVDELQKKVDKRCVLL
jgi:hypothetical protein